MHFLRTEIEIHIKPTVLFAFIMPGQHNFSSASMTYLFCQTIYPNYYHTKLGRHSI